MNNSDAKNWDFFNRGRTDGEPAQPKMPDVETIHEAEAMPVHGTVEVDAPLLHVINTTKAALKNTGLNGLIREVEKMERNLHGKKFTISVVGEFSRGKSSFINKLFERDILPVGNLPTTAILTKVTYNQREMIVFVDSKGVKRPLTLTPQSWEGLTADMKKADPHGVAFVGISSEWLGKTGIEIIDTPGAGDLNEKRAMLINDALLCGDGAIITISALQALSLSEKEFIEQRLLAAKIPRLLLIVTHLDTVKPQERARVLQFIKSKLSLWNFDVPIFIPQGDLDVPDMDCSSFAGIDTIKAEIDKWVSDIGHQTRKRESVCTGLLSILDIAKSSVAEKEKLLLLDKEKRDEVLGQKKTQISGIQLYWEDLRLEILKRGNKCYEWLRNAVREKTETLIERLQYEAAHTNNPQKWWEEDYPYRLKVELMNLAVSLESGLTQVYSNDVRWLNDVLDKQFKLSVFVRKDVIADKVLFKDVKSPSDIEFENIDKQRMWARIGTGAVTVAGFALFAASGMLPIVATIGIGTGSSLVLEKIFRGKIEEQQRAIKEAIAKDIPRVIDSALAISEQRLQEAYEKIAREASAQEELWVRAQLEALADTENKLGGGRSDELTKVAEPIESAIRDIYALIER